MSFDFTVLGPDDFSTKIGIMKIKGMCSMAVKTSLIKSLVRRIVLFHFFALFL